MSRPTALMCFKPVESKTFIPFFSHPLSHHASPQHHSCLPCAPHHHAFVTMDHSHGVHSQFCLPQFCQSRQMKHVRWHLEEKAFWFIMELSMDKSYFFWHSLWSQGLITFQGTVALLSNSLGPWCMCACVCLNMVGKWQQGPVWESENDWGVKHLPPILTSYDWKHHSALSSERNRVQVQ